MRTCTLAFLLGILLLQFFSFLPAKIYILALSLLGIFLAKKFPKLKLLTASCFGFVWVLLIAHIINSWTLPHELEGKSILVTGYIASIPEKVEHGNSFLFLLKTVQTKPTRGFIKLSASVPNLHAGDQWQFMVHLKQIHGLMNPGGFDYEAWAFQNGIRANGYVVESGQNKLLGQAGYHYWLNRLRQNLKEKINANLPVSNTSPWIVALALGERDNISPENWQILRNTGTNHLMAIAGLHIGFLTSLIYFLVSWLWRRSAVLTLKFPAPHAGAIAALLAAIIYSALAGFSIPTQRACLMVITGLIMLLQRRRILSWQAWCMAMLGVLLLNPLSVLTESFWLSFGSVAIIIYGVSGRLNASGMWWKVGRLQWVVSLGLIPLGVWLFQQCSFVSFVANSIAIPWVGFCIVPLTLLGCFCLLFSAKLGGLILFAADKMLSVLWIVLTFLSHLSWATWYQMIPVPWILVAACLGVIMLLFPVGFPGRMLGVIWFAPLIFYHAPKPSFGEVYFTLLDVGQGLASVVQTRNHLLVFDTGSKLSANFDMGESVVVPFLHANNTKKIDMLVISHGDNDHIGGARAVLENFFVREIKTSVPEKIAPFPASHCLQNQTWEWDGVKFAFLYPAAVNLNLNNDSSCVLKITDAYAHSILLTGDIEKYAENVLLQTEKNNLSADILVAPHHGSKTSGLDAFIDAVHSSVVLFAVGYHNRFRFPNVGVVAKYQQRGVKMYATDKAGAVQFVLSRDKIEPRLYRVDHQHFWSNYGVD